MVVVSSDTTHGINLLLVGRSGNGKSSTGNSILGRKEFTPHSSTSTIDTYKFHALLVVLKYGVRFTNQEKEAVKMIKAMFGEDVIKNYGIIVMTYGDSFDLDMESDGVTFEKWCDDQTGDVRILFDECDKRCVLFDNRSKNAEKTEKQIEQLLFLVSGITQYRLPYSCDDYKNAEPARRSLIVYGKLPLLGLKTEATVSNINKQLDQIRKQEQRGSINDLRKLSNELQEHKSWLEKEDEGTGLIKHLLITIAITEMRIKTMMDKEKKNEELRKEKRGQKDDKSGLTKSRGREDKQASLMPVLFYSHWTVIYVLISIVLRCTPSRIKLVPAIIERFCDMYTFMWSLLLPSNIMHDNRLISVTNQIKAKIAQFRTQLN